MRKHFLLLFLLTLLPLAGWAQTATFGEMSLGNYTYGDLNLPVPQVKDSEGAILNAKDHYTVVEGAFTDEACTKQVANLKDLKADETKYYRKVEGKGTYVGQSKTAWFTVTKKTLNITVSTDFKRDYNTTADPTIADNWDGEGFVNTSGEIGGWKDDKTVLTGTLQYTYAGKGNRTYPGGVYPITFSGLSSDNYDIKYPTDMNFTIVGTDLSSKDVTVKEGTAFADKTYKGDFYTAADLTGLKLVWGEKELVQGTDFDVVLKAVYNFTSYSAQTGNNQLATGKVNVLSKDASDNSAIVEVTDNSVNGFVGKKYKVALTANGTTRTQLMGDGSGDDYTTASGIWVTVERSNTAGDIAMNVGPYKYGVKFKGNYSGSKAAGWVTEAKFNIAKAPIVVSIENIEKTYNGTNWKNHNFGTVLYTLAEYNAAQAPASAIDQDAFDALPFAQKVKTAAEATFIYSGLVGEDLASAEKIVAVKNGFTAPTSVMITTDAQDVKEGGYNLTISGATAGSSTNYYIAEYIPGKLIIKQAKLELKANDAKKNFDDDDPTFTLAATANLVNGHRIEGVTFTREGGETAGSYAITPVYTDAKVYSNFGTKDQKDETGNYKFAVATEKGKLTIGKSTIYVTIKDNSKFYGQEDPDFDYVVTGLAKGDQLADFTISRAGAGTAAGENAGSYALTAEVANPNTDKYDKVIVASGIFTIKQTLLIFEMQPQNVVKDDTKAKLSKNKVKVTGVFNDDDPTTLYDLDFNGVTLSTDKITNEDNTYATGYKATLTTAAAKNYLIITNATTNPVGTGTTINGKLIVNNGTAAVLDLATAANVANNIAAKESEKASVTMPHLALNAKEWYAVVLPFATTPAELVQELGVYVVVDRIKSSSINAKGEVTVNFEMEWDEIPAGEPFLVKPAAVSDLSSTNFTKKLVVKNITAKETDNATFTGTYADGQKLLWGKDLDGTTDKEGAAYRWLAHKEYKGDNKWKNPKSNVHPLAPMEAYLVLDPAATGARIFVEDLDDNGTTAIKELGVDGTNKAYSVDGWYTLNGVKLQAAPTAKGVYINNGKKVVIK